MRRWGSVQLRPLEDEANEAAAVDVGPMHQAGTHVDFDGAVMEVGPHETRIRGHVGLGVLLGLYYANELLSIELGESHASAYGHIGLVLEDD